MEHFAAPRPHRNIHLFWDQDTSDIIEAFVRQVAEALACHFALLRGGIIRDGDTLREQLGAIYDFPDRQRGRPETWDGVVDWLGDLSWLTGDPVGVDGVKGFILLYHDPATLFTADAYDFAVLLDVLGRNVERIGYDVPFHIILGPVDDRRLDTFIDLLKVSECFCPACRYPCPPPSRGCRAHE